MKYFSLLFILILSHNTLFSQDIDSLTTVLENEMEKRDFYDNQKMEYIGQLEKKASNASDLTEKYIINNKIFKAYQYYSFDKALSYLEKNIVLAEKIDDKQLLNKAKVSLGLLLVNTGRYKESIDILNSIETDSLQQSLVNDYYIAYKEGYSGLTYYTTVKSRKSNYSKLYTKYQDSLYTRLKPNSEEILRLKEKQYRDQRRLEQAFEVNSKRLGSVQMSTRGYSLVNFERSLLHELSGNHKKRKKHLILSAISDIRASIKDNASMGSLAKIMFEEKDIDRAHRYINFSFDDAEFYNSQLRFVNIANSLPTITKAYEARNKRQNTRLKKLLYAISILTGFLIISIYLVFRQVKKVSIARNQLKNANDKLNTYNLKLNESNEDLKRLYEELSELDKVKEHYIGTFLNLYSEYITKLDVYRKLVRKYVKANQMNSLLKLSKSKQFIDEELDIFNKNFDKSFLHIYPNFVESVNKLLKPNKQITLENKNTLNTELRILALIRLGITSSSRIAKILRYSVNTIYNYRASIKKLSKDKSNFEEMIKKI